MKGCLSVTDYEVTVWLKDGTKLNLGLMPECMAAEMVDIVAGVVEGDDVSYDGEIGLDFTWGFPADGIAFVTARKHVRPEVIMDRFSDAMRRYMADSRNSPFLR